MIVHIFCIQGLGASEHDIHKLFDILCFQKPGWNSVPEFGGWDRKTPGATDYSVVFSRARANKKQQKNDVNRHSLGNEQELMVKKQQHQHYQQDDSVMVILYFLVSLFLLFIISHFPITILHLTDLYM